MSSVFQIKVTLWKRQSCWNCESLFQQIVAKWKITKPQRKKSISPDWTRRSGSSGRAVAARGKFAIILALLHSENKFICVVPGQLTLWYKSSRIALSRQIIPQRLCEKRPIFRNTSGLDKCSVFSVPMRHDDEGQPDNENRTATWMLRVDNSDTGIYGLRGNLIIFPPISSRTFSSLNVRKEIESSNNDVIFS